VKRGAVTARERRLLQRAQPPGELLDQELLPIQRHLRSRVSGVDDQLGQSVGTVAVGKLSQPQSRHRSESVHFDADRTVATRDAGCDRLERTSLHALHHVTSPASQRCSWIGESAR
jgi:hypothetical protein